jgi:hypothetical protein
MAHNNPAKQLCTDKSSEEPFSDTTFVYMGEGRCDVPDDVVLVQAHPSAVKIHENAFEEQSLLVPKSTDMTDCSLPNF